jgi:3-demethylubiquinone-9 3-methyltransferase
MTVEFEIAGQAFTALNGGPHFQFNEAISFQIPCETQEEIDHYWERLSAGGEIQQCGWLKDKFGVSWYFRRPCRRCCGIPTRQSMAASSRKGPTGQRNIRPSSSRSMTFRPR